MIGEYDPGNFFALPYLRKETLSLTHRRNYNYDAGQEIWIGTPEPRDVREQ